MKTRTALPSIPITLIAFFALAVCSLGKLSGHELEDGCIEKAMAIVVRDGVATIELSVGINPATMEQQLGTWLAKSADSEKRGSDPDQGDDAVDQKTAAQETADHESKPVAPNERSQEDDLNARFRQYAFEQFAKEINVEIDGRKVPLSKVSVEQSPRHHFDLIAKYSFSIPKQQGQPQSKLMINDLTLQKMIGGSRYSLKAAGKSILFKSNVSPIVVRAERNDLGKLSEKGLAKARRIEAVVGGTPGTEIEKK